MNGKTFNVPVSNGLLEPKHYQAMRGDAIWFFLYLIDKQTKRVDSNGHGKVSGGMPIRDSAVAGAFGCSRWTVIRWRETLIQGGYITATRTPYGYVYAITKPKKWKEGTKRDVTENAHQTGIIQLRCADVLQRCADSPQTKKTVQDTTVVSNAAAADSPSQMEEKQLQIVWKYYLDAFDKDESFTIQRKKQGLARMRDRSWKDPVITMTAVIDMAKDLSAKKPFFANWHCIFGKRETFDSLLQEYEENGDVPEAASLPEANYSEGQTCH